MKIAHIYIYGVIDYCQDEQASKYGFVNLKDVKNQLDNQPNFDEIKVHIHSEGGVCSEGFAIHDFLRSQGKPITTQIEGSCYSIATVIALAGDKRIMTSNSEFLIHNPWGWAGGEKEEIQKYADELGILEDKIADFYASKTKITRDDALVMMKVTTTFTPEVALEKGFITEIAQVMKAVAMFENNINKNKNNMSENLTKKEFEGMFESFGKKIAKAINNIGKGNKPVALILQDANANEIDFPDLADGDTPKIGDKATLGGSPIPDGDYVFPSLENITIAFLNGAVAEVATPDEENQEMEALKNENDSLKAEIENLKTQNSKKDSDLKNFKNQVEKEFDSLKKSIGSNYNFKNEMNGNQGEGEGNPQARKLFKNKD